MSTATPHETRQITPQIILNLGHEAYHSQSGMPYVTAHLLMRYIQGGLDHYLGQIRHPEEAGPAQQFGAAFHLLMESEQKFLATYIWGAEPINSATGFPFGRETKKWQKFAEEHAKVSDRKLLTTPEAEKLLAMRTAVMDTPAVRSLLTGAGQHEVCVRAMLCGLPCQSLMDYVRKPGYAIVDYKTCADLANIFDDIIGYKYDLQFAFYRMMMREARQVVSPVFLICVDKQEQPACCVIQLSENLLYEAEQKVLFYLEKLKGDLIYHACH